MSPFSSVTLWIIAAVVAASLAAFQNPKIAQDWILEPYRVWRGKGYYTLLTSGFIHADWAHLAFNMLTLYFFGNALQNWYELGLDIPGIWVAGLFVSGVIVSSLPSLYTHRNNKAYATLGASGGVEAVLFATVLLNPMSDICLYFAICIPGILAALLFLAYSYFQSKNGQDHINHEAHLTGALYGLFWQTLLTPDAWGRLLAEILG
jgi:membrane associated rhomboid family serine protease